MTEILAPHRVRVRAPGKVNVYLGVGDVMEDGYHDVATAYQAVSLSDDVIAERAADFTVAIRDSAGNLQQQGGANLALRAVKALARRSGYVGGVRIIIEKNLPRAGGMGGGAADAAAALIACDALWGLGSTRDKLMTLAARIGSEVPFALLGGTAVGTGRGDQLSHALATGIFYWVLVPNRKGLNPVDVYRTLDEHRADYAHELRQVDTSPTVPMEVLHALRAGDPNMLAETMHNDLQVAVFKLMPELADLIELGEMNGALAGIVDGAGPTVAFLTAGKSASLELQVALSASGYFVHRVTSPAPGSKTVGD